MFSIYRNIQRNIYKTLKRGICITKDDNITSRLKYITGVLKNKDKNDIDTIHVDKKELNIYYDDLEKEKNQLQDFCMLFACAKESGNKLHMEHYLN